MSIMDPISKSPTQRGRRVVDAAPALFDKTLLKDEMTVQIATRELERHLVNPATRLEETIAELIELDAVPHAFEYVLSGKFSVLFIFILSVADMTQSRGRGVIWSPPHGDR